MAMLALRRTDVTFDRFTAWDNRARVAQQNDADFANWLAVLRAAFDMRKIDARLRAERLLRRCMSEAETAGAQPAADWLVHGERLSQERTERQQMWIARSQAVAALLYEFRHANLIHDAGPTPEVAAMPWDKPGRITERCSTLFETGDIDADQLSAANQIARVYQAITASLFARAGKLQPGSGGKSEPITLTIALIHKFTYKPWADAMTHDPNQNLPLVIDVVVDGHSIFETSRANHMHYRRGLRLVQSGLRLYSELREKAEAANPELRGEA